jgi:hypothetical protein
MTESLLKKVWKAMADNYKTDGEHDLKEDARYQEIVRHIKEDSMMTQFQVTFTGCIICSNIFLLGVWLSQDIIVKILCGILAMFWVFLAFMITNFMRKIRGC